MSGRDFNSRDYQKSIAEDSFAKLKEGVLELVSKTNFQRYLMIVKSTGIISPAMIRSQNVLNFGYALYLLLRPKGEDGAVIEKVVRRWIVLAILTDRYSGDFQRMIKDSAKGLFDVVVVWKLDRFARNRYDSAHYKAALKKNGVRVISAKENIADGPEGIILESMLKGMAEYYSAELSVKVIRGHTENALKCKYNGGIPTLGFAIDANKQYQPDPVNAPIVLDIFKMYDTGSTMKQIMDHLNALGVTTV